MIIEAVDQDAATDKAESLGIYFNGCDDGIDCDCCGDRWYGSHKLTFPYSYGKFNTDKLALLVATRYNAKVLDSNTSYVVFDDVEIYANFMTNEYGHSDPDTRIFYADGTVKEFKPDGLRRISS